MQKPIGSSFPVKKCQKELGQKLKQQQMFSGRGISLSIIIEIRISPNSFLLSLSRVHHPWESDTALVPVGFGQRYVPKYQCFVQEQSPFSIPSRITSRISSSEKSSGRLFIISTKVTPIQPSTLRISVPFCCGYRFYC